MKKMIKYPSIEQFRTVVKNVQHMSAYVGQDENGDSIFDYSKPKPMLKFTASEKIHGTNAAVCFNTFGGLWVQSRSNIITPEKDNNGCALFVEKTRNAWLKILEYLCYEHEINTDTHTISVYFEFCGGNIQKNSAVSGLDKRAIIFEHFKVSPINSESEESSKWYKTLLIDDKDSNIYNIMNFPTYDIEIDFNNPEFSQNELIKLVEEVIEPSSPVGKQFDIENNIGEGVVCSYLTENNELIQFKVKGEKHSKSPVKKLKEVDLALLDAMDKFVETITHTWRFEQALVEIFGNDFENTIDRKRIGEYMKWVAQDTIKEEMDLITNSGFEMKPIMSRVNKKAKDYFFAVEKI